MLHRRAQLVRLRNRIHAVFADHGCDRKGNARNCWGDVARQWLTELPLPPSSRVVVTDLLEAIDALQWIGDHLDAVLTQMAKADPRVKALTALPGIGRLTAR